MKQAAPSNNWHYNPKLRSLSRELRNRATKAERLLWQGLLRFKRLNGHMFTRQRPVLNYIADFMCKEKLLIIEVDGITHWEEKAIKKDKEREKKLKEVGFEVIRFRDWEIFNTIDLVEIKILEAMGEYD